MNKGCLLFAHDGDIDYGSQAVLAARLAIKYLAVPVSLVTDQKTLSSIKTKFDQLPFDQIIFVEKPKTTNTRSLANGDDRITIQFINSNRSTAYDLTPYDRTLIIDTDFLIQSDTLGKYWNSTEQFLITPEMIDLTYLGEKNLDFNINQFSIQTLWATNIMFSKTPEVKILFDLVEHIKNNYNYYAAIYGFPYQQYRNDFAFSIACHIISGYGIDPWWGELPSPIWIKDTDLLYRIKNRSLTFLIKDHNKKDNWVALTVKDQDIHFMNKLNLLENLDKLMEFSND
jgi:hypothetical protein